MAKSSVRRNNCGFRRYFLSIFGKTELFMSHSALYETYKTRLQEIADLRYAMALLQWDQETYLPANSHASRSRQMATLGELAHVKFTHPDLGALLQQLQNAGDLGETEQHNLRLSWEDYERTAKLPAPFVRRLTEATSTAFHAWADARKKNRFSLFQKELEQLLQLKKEEAELLGYEEGTPYNALLHQHDKGSTVRQLDETLGALATPLRQLLQQVQAKPQVDDRFLFNHYPKQEQWHFGLHLLGEMGFNFNKGRQDVSAHPFTTSFGNDDVRLTTRIDENDFGNMTWSCLHEGGHGLYEQGLPAGQYGLPLGEAASFTVHESQSRLWENNIGRSLAYWQFHYPGLQQRFPDALAGVGVAQFYRGINKVQPSFIRTEADELTYHFHIIIRYEIEKQLMAGNLQVADIPAAWNELYLKHLGVTVPDDARGCLQDVHWSHGSFGYFPTYSLGTAMAAQLFRTYTRQQPDFHEELLRGNTGKILIWLRNCIHNFGRRFTTNELCQQITGEPLNTKHLLDYLREKFTRVYQ
jgi:carboxypeptidase Taq